MPFCPRLPLVIFGICILSLAPPAANAALPPTPVQPRESTSKDATAILLRYHFQQGECSRYRLKLEGKGALTTGNDRLVLPLTLLLEYSVTQTVTAAHPDGAAELKLVYSCQKELLNGGEPTALPPAPQPITLVVTPEGKATTPQTAPAPQAAALPGFDPALLTDLAGMVTFPVHAVQPGETWTGAIASTEGQVSTTLLDAVQEKGRRVARLKQSFALPLRLPGGSTGRQAGDLSIRFDCEAGRIEAATGQVDTILDLENGAQHLDLLLKLTFTPEPAARKAPQAPGEDTRASG